MFAGGQGHFHGEFGRDARPLHHSGGFQGCERGGDQERLPQARQEAASRRQQARSEGGLALRRAQRRLRDRRRRRQAQGLRPRRDRRRGQAALPRLRRRAAGRRLGGGPGGSHFESFSFGPDGFQRRGGAGGGFGGGFEDLLRGMFGGAAARRRARPSVRAGGFRRGRRRPGPARGLDHPLAGRRQGHQDARASADRQGGRGEDPGRPRQRPADPAQGPGLAERDRQGRRRADHRQRRAASGVQAGRRRPAARSADHALRGGARRQGAGADARRRGRTGDPARHQFRPHLPAQGQGPQGQEPAPAICSPPCASCCPSTPTTSSRS